MGRWLPNLVSVYRADLNNGVTIRPVFWSLHDVRTTMLGKPEVTRFMGAQYRFQVLSIYWLR